MSAAVRHAAEKKYGTIAAFAEAAGVAESTVYRFFSSGDATVDSLIKMASAVGLRLWIAEKSERLLAYAPIEGDEPAPRPKKSKAKK